MWRSVRWLDRCIKHHQASGKAATQNLFAIVQGGLDQDLRDKCLTEMIQRREEVAGYAIGGLSGGEEKGNQSILAVLIAYINHAFTQLSFGRCWFSVSRIRNQTLKPFRIAQCAERLPADREGISFCSSDLACLSIPGPRYSMGIGFAGG